MSDQYDSYRRRADENHRRAMECKRRAVERPESAATYNRQHDEALAEMYFHDAMARGHSGNGSSTRSEAQELKARNAKGLGAAVNDQKIFRDTLDRLIDHHLSRNAED